MKGLVETLPPPPPRFARKLTVELTEQELQDLTAFIGKTGHSTVEKLFPEHDASENDQMNDTLYAFYRTLIGHEDDL